jgi:Uncharacterized protein conserved in bacteria (DUF2199)
LFFIRGCLEIPLLDSSEVFIWGLWALVKEEVFNEISESWEEESRETRRGLPLGGDQALEDEPARSKLGWRIRSRYTKKPSI